MKLSGLLLTIFFFATYHSFAQTEGHNTMFMFNKMYYNPAYTGSRDVTSVNAFYRDQWNAIDGAPKSYGVNIDATLGNGNTDQIRQIGLGLTFTSEQIGVEKKQDIFAYYSFRFQLENESILSLGLRAGTELYSANYATLNPYQQFDPNLAKDVKSVSLFNFGAGMFWHKQDYYLGIGIPNIIENYFDKNEKNTQNKRARQVRGYYATTGYVLHSGETVDILPQVVARYSGNELYSLPFNADINVSFIFSKRVLFGVTYRTDKSLEGMMRIQATRNLSIGYSYDYLLSGLSGYNNGAHEVILGIDFAKRHYGDYDKVHFITLF